MRRAVPIETVREYVEQQMAEYEPVYEREMELGERGPNWPIAFPRYVWLYILHWKALGRAERAGVGAVLAEETGPELLEQLGLLDEQLHAQARSEREATAPVEMVPRDLTQDAVPVFWWSQTVISASADLWCRRCQRERQLPGKPRAESSKRALIDLEHRLAQVQETLVGSKATLALEAVHGYVTRACDVLGDCREAGNPVDPDELQTIADAIEDACRHSLERRLWVINKALGGSNPHRGAEAVHHQAELAACYVAAWRVLGVRGVNEHERREKLEQAREAAHAAVVACPEAEDQVPALGRFEMDKIAIELRSLARALDTEVGADHESR